MKLMDAAEKVLSEDPRTRHNKFLWLYMTKVLREMGFRLWIEYDPALPSPDSMLTERRQLLNQKNKFPQDFEAEEGVTYERPKV